MNRAVLTFALLLFSVLLWTRTYSFRTFEYFRKIRKTRASTMAATRGSKGRSKSPAAPTRGRSRSATPTQPKRVSSTRRSMGTRSESELAKTSAKSGLKKFAIVLGICLALSQVLSFQASGSRIGFKYLQKSYLTIIGVQLLFWLHASGIVFGNRPTEHYYDLVGAITNVGTIVASVHFNGGASALTQRQLILSSFVVLWATRLGVFLFQRVRRAGSDVRFEEMKKRPLSFAVAWILQGLWVFLTTLPVTSLNAGNVAARTPLRTQDLIGMSLWVVGFVIEVVADAQKSAFKRNKNNKFKFIQSGLWKLSRHPNYFGEITLWVGAYLMANAGMPPFSLQAKVTALSPIFVAVLLIFVSGVNLLEKANDTNFGTSKGYMVYKASTPTLVPFVGRKGDAPF